MSYCHNCGKQNPEGSKFCQHCGIELEKTGSNLDIDKKPSFKEIHTENRKLIDTNTSPYPYAISTSKLVILSIVTFGFYEIYWFYKHWKSLKADKNLKVTPWARSLFSPLYASSLFKNVSNSVKEVDVNKGLNSTSLALIYFILIILSRLPEPYWWISILSFLPLIPVQNTINYYWEKKFGNNLVKSNFGGWNFIWTIIGGIVLIIALYGTTYPTESSNTSTGVNTTTSSTELEATYGKNFMNSCNDDGTKYQSCSCLLKYLRTNYTLSERIDMDAEYTKTQQIPQALTNALKACADSN